MGTGKQRSTFISYSRHNKDFAVRLARELKASGFSVWLDQLDIPPGSRWDDELEAALERCEIFMVILTPASMASDNVKDEIGYAIDTRKRILPVLLESTTIPLRLRRFQYVDFSGKSFDEGVDGAKDLLRTLIEAQTNPNLEIPPIFRGQDVQVDQAAHEDARRLAAQQAERLAELKAEEERVAKAEADRKAKEEAERKAGEEAERIAQEKAEQERLAQARAKPEQRAQAKAEKERKAKEEAERLAAQKAEEERVAKVKAEAERAATQKAEEDRLAQAKAKEEADRSARAEAERRAKEDADRVATRKAEEERIARAKTEGEHKQEEAARLASLRAGEERKKQEPEIRASQSAVPAPALLQAAAQGAPSKPKSRLPLIIGAVAVLGVCAVIGVIVLSNLGNRGSVATEPPQAEFVEQMPATEVPATEAPAERIATEAPVVDDPVQVPVTGDLHVFADEFTDPGSGWYTDDGSYYENGSYYYLIDDQFIYTREAPASFLEYGPDVIIRTWVNFAEDTAVGLYCRGQDDGSFYEFMVSSTTYDIWYNDGSNWDVLVSDTLSSDVGYPYMMEAQCVGDSLAFFVNYVEVARVSDSRISTAGRFGLVGATSNSDGSAPAFDNFFVYAPFYTSSCMTDSNVAHDIEFENQSGVDLVIFSSDSECGAHLLGYLPAGTTTTLYVYERDPYTFVDPQAGHAVFEYIGEPDVTNVTIGQ